jgi:hypothetical protein
MLGHRVLMVTHIGRKTGLRRQTVLEVAHYDPATQECIVVAVWGEPPVFVSPLESAPQPGVPVSCLAQSRALLNNREKGGREEKKVGLSQLAQEESHFTRPYGPHQLLCG